MKSKSTRMQSMSLTLLAAAALAAASSSAIAAEGRGQRYSPGVGGSDMTSLLVPGWYGQAAIIHYHATKLKGDNGKDLSLAGTQPVPGVGNVPYSAKFGDLRTDVYAVLPRITYLSTTQVFGANLGFTAMLPIVKRQNSFSPNVTLGAPIPEPTATAVRNGVQTAIRNRLNGETTGIGDLELSPVLHWELGDNQAITFAPTVVVPTGQYDKDKPVNAGFGDFYTFRPSVQYGYIGDGWDVGVRGVLSFNTRNKDTDYKSGNMLNVDFQLMKFITDDLRLGLQGYVVRQISDDSSDDATTQAAIDAANGSRMRTYALGPALAWIMNGGEMMVEGKLLREFGSRNRTEGTAYWLTISKPFGL